MEDGGFAHEIKWAESILKNIVQFQITIYSPKTLFSIRNQEKVMR